MDTNISAEIDKLTKKQAAKDKKRKELSDQKKKIKQLYQDKEWYTCRALLGNQWAN